MNKKAQVDSVVKELVIGVGFLEGMWIAVGVNPQSEILKAFLEVFQSLDAPTSFFILFKILPFLLLIGTIVLIFTLGGWLGIIAVFLAFIAGITIVKFSTFAVILLVIAIIMGLVVFAD